MFGFDGDVKGLKEILFHIKNNSDGKYLSHKEVRAYARCLLTLKDTYNTTHGAEIATMLAAMSLPGLPHYDRSFLAERILNILENESEKNKNTKFTEEEGF